jgi:molybdopterin molybdotransferase
VLRGASLKKGEIVLSPRVIKPQDVGVLAASGVAEVGVAVPPRVAVMTTGSEISAPGTELRPGGIFDSNGPQLLAQLGARGFLATALGPVRDEPATLRDAMDKALEGFELLLLTGGVSAGDYDYVPTCLEDLGAKMIFQGVAMKPGKPTLFARRGDRFIFGLPGNPVSTFVAFEIFVVPLIFRCMGLTWEPATAGGKLARALERDHADRDEFLPVWHAGGRVEPLEYHGSAHLNALAKANGIIRFRRGVKHLAEGEEILVRLV